MKLDTVINEAVKIPPTPQIMPKLQQLLRNAESDPSDISKLLKVDVSLMAQVLRIANSTYYSISTPVQSLEEAIHFLGFKEIYKIVSIAAAKDVLGEALEAYNTAEGELMEHSVACAQMMDSIANVNETTNKEGYYSIGLLHGIGKIVINQYFQARGLSFYGGETSGVEEGLPEITLQLEQQVIGFDHVQAGYALLMKWKFPDELADPIRNQFDPEASECHKRASASLKISKDIAPLLLNEDADLESIEADQQLIELAGIKNSDWPIVLKKSLRAICNIKQMIN